MGKLVEAWEDKKEKELIQRELDHEREIVERDLERERQKILKEHKNERKYVYLDPDSIEKTDGQQWKRIMNAVLGFEYYKIY